MSKDVDTTHTFGVCEELVIEVRSVFDMLHWGSSQIWVTINPRSSYIHITDQHDMKTSFLKS
jgi:hypothetical protein